MLFRDSLFDQVPWFTWPIFATRSLISFSGLGAAIRISDCDKVKSDKSLIMHIEDWAEQEIKAGRLVVLLPRDSVEARLQARAVPYIHSDNIRHAYVKAQSLKSALHSETAHPVIAESKEAIIKAVDLTRNWKSLYPKGAVSLRTERTKRAYEKAFDQPDARNLARSIGFPMSPVKAERSAFFATLADDSQSNCPIRPGQLMLRGHTGNKRAAIRRDLLLMIGR